MPVCWWHFPIHFSLFPSRTFGIQTSGGYILGFVLIQHIEAQTKLTPYRRWHFQVHFLNENISILNKISLKFVSTGQINNMPTLVHIMAWRRSGDKPLSEPMMVSLPTHKCVIRPQWFERMTRSVTSQWSGTVSNLIKSSFSCVSH